MKNKIISLFLFYSLIHCLFTTTCISQEIIPLGDSLNTSDLSFLKGKIKDKMIVSLGELDHGDGSTFKHKTTIIKYLHEEMGFNVIAFEAPFIELEMLNVYNKKISVDSTKKELYSIWAKVNETQELFNYIEDENITLTGFDSRHVSHQTQITDSIIKYFKLDSTKSNITSTIDALDTLLRYEYKSATKINQEDKDVFFCVIDSLIESNNALKPNENKASFWRQVLVSVRGCAKNSWSEDGIQGELYRDSHMAQNLLWLINQKYKNEKIIVWAANFHIVRNQSLFFNRRAKKQYPNYKLMGDYLFEELSDAMYVLSFIHLQGNVAGLDHNIERKKGSLEYKLGIKNNYAFVDLKDCTEKLSINISYHEKYGEICSNQWNLICDALLFTKNVYPSTVISAEEK